MGRGKFYRTPAGRVRADLLAVSGVQYHGRSVEFRLLIRRELHATAYRARHDAWTAARLLDIYSAVAAPVTEAAARKAYIRSLHEQRAALSALLEPPPEREEMARHSRNDGAEGGLRPGNQRGDAGKAAYLGTLGGAGPFRSLEQLLAAMAGLNRTVEELRRDHA